MLFSETFRVCNRERLLLWLCLRLRLVFVGSSIGRNPSALDVSLAMKGFRFAASSASHIHTLFLSLIPTVFTPSPRYHHHHRLHLPSHHTHIYVQMIIRRCRPFLLSLFASSLYTKREINSFSFLLFFLMKKWKVCPFGFISWVRLVTNFFSACIQFFLCVVRNRTI